METVQTLTDDLYLLSITTGSAQYFLKSNMNTPRERLLVRFECLIVLNQIQLSPVDELHFLCVVPMKPLLKSHGNRIAWKAFMYLPDVSSSSHKRKRLYCHIRGNAKLPSPASYNSIYLPALQEQLTDEWNALFPFFPMQLSLSQHSMYSIKPARLRRRIQVIQPKAENKTDLMQHSDVQIHSIRPRSI